MGARGPIGKAPDKRHGHRSKAENAVTRIPVPSSVAPALGIDAHPLAASLYAALAEGVEGRYYTPALWQRARLTAHMLTVLLETNGRPSSQMYAALQADFKALLVDAGELRRLGIEMQPENPAPPRVTDFRARLRATETGGVS